jgi:hypothetical protein
LIRLNISENCCISNEQALRCLHLNFLCSVQVFESGISPEAQDLIKQLCTKDPAQRLCCVPGRGVDELRQHPFFKDFDWTMLFCRRMPSPFRGSTDTFRSGRNETARDAAQMRQKLDSFVADSLTAEQQVRSTATMRAHCIHSCVLCRLYSRILISIAIGYMNFFPLGHV